MKILHTSDWHLGKNLYDFSILNDQRHALDFLLELLSSEKIDAVIIAGDIYDRPVPSAEAVRLYDYFLTTAVTKLRVPVIAAAGNHDSKSRLEFGSKLYSESGYHIFGTVKADVGYVTLHDDFGQVRIYPVPWLHPAEMRVLLENPDIKTFDDAYRLLLEKITIDENVRNIAVAHGFFARLGGSEAEKELITSDSEINVGGMDIADSKYFAKFDYTALGHLHMPQRAGGEYVRYSGSLLKYSVSEERQKKSFTIIELHKKGDVKVTTMPIPALRDVRSITGSFGELMEPDYHQNKNFDDYVFADVTDFGVLYPMEKLRTLFPNLLGLRFALEPGAPEDFALQSRSTAQISTLELFRRFYRDTYAEEMTAESLEFLTKVIQKSEVAGE